jgi:hypothetical protein
MKKLVIAVVGGIAITVASAAAYAIENSSWIGGGTLHFRSKTRGEPAQVAEGEFTSDLGVSSSFVVLPIPEVLFPNPNTVTGTAQLAGPTILDVRNITTRRVNVDNEGSTTQLCLQSMIDSTINLASVTATAYTNKPPRGEDPVIPAGDAGFIIYQDTVDVRGGFTAIKNFTEVRGKITIVFTGLERNADGELIGFKGTIIIRFDGLRD